MRVLRCSGRECWPALADKASFPRDKACGDLVGPRGVQLLVELGVHVPDAGQGSDLLAGSCLLAAFHIRLPAIAKIAIPTRMPIRSARFP